MLPGSGDLRGARPGLLPQTCDLRRSGADLLPAARLLPADLLQAQEAWPLLRPVRRAWPWPSALRSSQSLLRSEVLLPGDLRRSRRDLLPPARDLRCPGHLLRSGSGVLPGSGDLRRSGLQLRTNM